MKAIYLDRKEDMEAATVVQKAFIRQGILLHLNATITRVELRGGQKVLHQVSAQMITIEN